MALYIVRARPKNDLSGLRKELNSGKILKLRPFGKTKTIWKNTTIWFIIQKLIQRWICFMDRRRLLYSSISHGKRKCS
jgi:hypothetical protein